MLGNMENLKVISILHKNSALKGKVNKRLTHSLIIRVSGSMKYTFEDKEIILNAGEMLFMPKNSKYTYEVISEGACLYTTINFDCDSNEGEARVYPLGEFYDAEYIMNHIADLWNLGNAAEKYRCLSLVYNLFYYAANIDSREYSDKKKFEIIVPGVEYMKKHIYDSSLKIDKMHTLCGVSDTYFRKIFIAKFGSTPKNYILEKRISRAKSIIDSGEFYSVKELASSVGYTDALYFSKVFKKHYGCSPNNLSK